MKTSDTKPAVRQAHRDYAQKTLGKEFGQLNDKQRSYALLKFYIEEIHNRLRNYISDEDLDEGFIDNSGDLGADFIYRSDGAVIIIQSKYAKENSTIDLKDVLHFQSVLKRIDSPAFRKHSNSKPRELVSEIDLANDTFTMRFVTLGRIEGQANTQTEEAPDLPPVPNLGDRVTFEFLDETQLTEELRHALSIEGGIPGECEIVTFGTRGKRSDITEITIGEHRSCVLVVPASQIVNLFKQHKEALFTLNVRNYIGSTATNRMIADTARTRPSDFFPLNNGISCLATKIDVGPKNDRVTATGLQVINGAQTVRSLVKANARSKWRPPDHEPALLVRITEVSGYGREGKFREDIIRANNTQNVIKASDFRSNDPIQNDLKKKFGTYNRLGKSVQYMPKRTEGKRPNAIVIRIEEFAKSIYSFLRDPISFSGSTSFLFDDSPLGGYCVVFGDGKEVWLTMPEEEFRLRSSIWWLAVNFAERLKEERAETTDARDKAAQERRWPLIFCSRLILERSFGAEGYQAELRRFYKGDWRFNEGKPGKWFEQIYDKAKRSLLFAYAQATQQSGFVHRNWMRDEKTVESLKRVILAGLLDPVKPLDQMD